ncbi:uncharacterized protein VTP21DRAFT_1729 [Calcarisporiella thermophila]|uniref:uncharacterized protein n=1 Tax=Calcarisporiella thermophila TaxID=911321 RepID=UPI0037428274
MTGANLNERSIADILDQGSRQTEREAITHLEDAILLVTRRVRMSLWRIPGDDTENYYKDLDALWHDIHQIFVTILSLPSVPVAVQLLLNLTSDILTDYIPSFFPALRQHPPRALPEQESAQIQHALRELDLAWTHILRKMASTASISVTDRVRVENVLMDVQERAREWGVEPPSKALAAIRQPESG